MPAEAENSPYTYPAGYIEDILKSVKTIAMVGASADKTKFSYGVLRVLHAPLSGGAVEVLCGQPEQKYGVRFAASGSSTGPRRTAKRSASATSCSRSPGFSVPRTMSATSTSSRTTNLHRGAPVACEPEPWTRLIAGSMRTIDEASTRQLLWTSASPDSWKHQSRCRCW